MNAAKRVRLTREQTAERLGITLSGLQPIERRKQLTPYLDSAKCRFYYADDVDALKAYRAIHNKRGRPKGSRSKKQVTYATFAPELDPFGERGAMAAKIFAAFKARRSLADIVIELEVSPEYVRTLHAEYMRSLGAPMPEDADRTTRLQSRDDRYEHELELERIRAAAAVEAARVAAREASAPVKEASAPRPYERRKA